MFGLVEQNYTLPKEVLEDLGVNLFEYERFQYQEFNYNKFEYNKFSFDKFQPEEIGITILRRGVIGVYKIGYMY